MKNDVHVCGPTVLQEVAMRSVTKTQVEVENGDDEDEDEEVAQTVNTL